MQIHIDFDVYKALTTLRKSEVDSYNAVLRRLLKLPVENALMAAAEGRPNNALAAYAEGNFPEHRNALAALMEGAWFDNVFLPEGTKFRANYKGQTYSGEIRNGVWLDSEGITQTSPSAAAGAISNTNVNGWRFWYALLPGTSEWRRMDEFKK